jgi:hypothetical protein
MIGFAELLLLLLAVPVLFIGGVVWFLIRSFRRSSQGTGQRPVVERLAELESLRKAGQISTEEYEKQRAAIISCV